MKKSELRALITESVKQAINELSPSTIRNATDKMVQKGQPKRAGRLESNYINSMLSVFKGKTLSVLGESEITNFRTQTERKGYQQTTSLWIETGIQNENCLEYERIVEYDSIKHEYLYYKGDKRKLKININEIAITLQDFNLIRNIINTFNDNKNSKFNKKEYFKIQGY